jgi:hypothetical protein
MATVRDFEIDALRVAKPQEEVSAVVRLVDCDGEKMIQIDTFGRASREFPRKLSQTIRLDEAAFRKLVALGDGHF